MLPETGPAWTAHLAQLADATLFGRTDSWYMGANIPGKPRQLLNYPSSGIYIDRLRDCAANELRRLPLRYLSPTVPAPPPPPHHTANGRRDLRSVLAGADQCEHYR